RLDELRNDITRETPACFEPTIDYVVTKVPRFAFEKFPDADATLTTQMKSVGETMAIGRTFKESLQKALRGLETGHFGLGCDRNDRWGTSRQPDLNEISGKLATPSADRIWFIRYALKAGMTVEDIHQRSYIDRWFLNHIREIVEMEDRLRACPNLEAATASNGRLPLLLEAKQYGFPARQLAHLWHTTETDVRAVRQSHGIEATFKLVDTCAAEFEAFTPYYYSAYETPIKQLATDERRLTHIKSDPAIGVNLCSSVANLEDETRPPKDKDCIMILGGGPNRIGQGIEFDYCCCQAAFALREAGFDTIMVNSNPETVSTDYDTSDMLFFEPLTTEAVLNSADRLHAKALIVQ